MATKEKTNPTVNWDIKDRFYYLKNNVFDVL